MPLQLICFLFLETLRNYFSQYGEVVDCVIMKDKSTNQSRGFGFVKFKDPNCVRTVLDTKPHNLDGRNVRTEKLIHFSQKSWLIFYHMYFQWYQMIIKAEQCKWKLKDSRGLILCSYRLTLSHALQEECSQRRQEPKMAG